MRISMEEILGSALRLSEDDTILFVTLGLDPYTRVYHAPGFNPRKIIYKRG